MPSSISSIPGIGKAGHNGEQTMDDPTSKHGGTSAASITHVKHEKRPEGGAAGTTGVQAAWPGLSTLGAPGTTPTPGTTLALGTLSAPGTSTGASTLFAPGTSSAPGNATSLAEEVKVKAEAEAKNIGRRGGRSSTLPTQVLSTRCQERRFNPKWTEYSTRRGRFMCNVDLNGVIVKGDGSYSSPIEAKMAVAKKALTYVDKVPPRQTLELAPNYPSVARDPRAPVVREPISHQAATSTGRIARSSPHEDPRRLLERVHATFGGQTPNAALLSDPVVAQAFLAGITMGTTIGASLNAAHGTQSRATQGPGGVDRPYDPREASPLRERDYYQSRMYRDRSDRSSPNRGRSAYDGSRGRH
jgi:hypothetical protein